MPRDLQSEGTGTGLPLTESPNSVSASDASPETISASRFVIYRGGNEGASAAKAGAKSKKNLYPYTRPLTSSDVDSCVALENAAFTNEAERCSKEKVLHESVLVWPSSDVPMKQIRGEFEYRLNTCGELSLGLFCTALPDSKIPAETLKTGRPVETGRKDGGINVLLAHVIATRTFADRVTDATMDFPSDWKNETPQESQLGHQEGGRTICVHSLGVLPGYAGRGLGKTLMVAYLQQMNGAGIADRIAIIAHDHLVAYYENLGFINLGTSKVSFGGGGWVDMVFELKSVEARTAYG